MIIPLERNPLFSLLRVDFLLCIAVRCRMFLCLYFLVKSQSHSSYILLGGNYEKLGNFSVCFLGVVHQISRGVSLQKYLCSIGGLFENELWPRSPDNRRNSHQKNQSIWRGGGILDTVSRLLLVWGEIYMKKDSAVSGVADRGYFLFQK